MKKYTEESSTLISKNDRGDFIRVSRIKPENGRGMEAVDVRLFFTDSYGAQRPTQKGVRIHEEVLKEVVIAILDALTVDEFNEVMDHFPDEEETEEVENSRFDDGCTVEGRNDEKI